MSTRYENSVTDRDGNVLVGATWALFLKGTDTQADAFADEARTVLLDDDARVTDANGLLSFYAAPGSYDLRVTYGGTTVELGDLTLFNAASVLNAEVTTNKATDLSVPDDTKYPTTLAVATALLAAGIGDNPVGTWDASGHSFPTSGGSGPAGAVAEGDSWEISVAGTMPSSPPTQLFSIGDLIIAKLDVPGQTLANWVRVQANIVGQTLKKGNYLSELHANKPLARTNLGLGSVATHDAADFDAAGAAADAQAAAEAYTDAHVVGLWNDRGGFDASVNAYPSSGGSGAAGAIKKGDIWRISVPGTLPGYGDVEINDTVRALTNAPGNTAANWAPAKNNAQTSVSGNAGTATALQTPRAIDGQSFDGTADIAVVAPGTHAASSKAAPVDPDELPLADSAASYVLKKLTWANLKATLKTYLDTLYAAIGAITGSGLTMSTAKLLGRSTASTGAVEEIMVGSGLTLSGGTLSASGGGGSGLTPPVLADWTWVNQGGATATDETDIMVGPVACAGILVVPPNGDSVNVRMLAKSLPPAPWTVTIAMQATAPNGNVNWAAGLALRESSSGKLLEVAATGSEGFYFYKDNSPTSQNSGYGAASYPYGFRPELIWMRLRDDGVTTTMEYLTAGTKHAVTVATRGSTDFLTPDQICLMVDNILGTGTPSVLRVAFVHYDES